ncbi:MAG: ribonuclease HII [Candidatus Moraniibacteriota bacterium]
MENVQVIESDKVIVGIDEAGRGPLCGPVVAAAVVFRESEEILSKLPEWKFIRDSKKLSEKQREKMFDFVMEQSFVGVGMMHADTIDRVNILEATFLAMKSAIASLRQQLAKSNEQKIRDEDFRILVDGNQLIPNIPVEQHAIVNGDALMKVIAAASIIAKVTRDRMMLEYDRTYPQYGFAQHKGYGTKVHMIVLRKFGPCPIHRMSFRPVFLSIPENANKRFFGK